jgi:hypothetical protein
MSGPPTAREWIADFAGRLPGGAAAVPSAEEQRFILELSRIAAHASERIAAPIISYMVGIVLAPLDEAARTEELARLVAELEAASAR